jgi:hypothetical protein
VSITQNVYSLGTAIAQIVAPSADSQRVTIKNLQPGSTPGEYARDGYAFQFSTSFTIAANGTATFSVQTPSEGIQLVSYQIRSTSAQVNAALIEGATITTAGTPSATFNLNRQSSRVAASVFDSVSSISGGTVIASELITSSNNVAGAAFSDKVYSLRGSQKYAMRFANAGNQETTAFFDLVFAEQYNGHHNVWLGDQDASYMLEGGEHVQFFLEAGEAITAMSEGTAVRVAVLRQD